MKAGWQKKSIGNFCEVIAGQSPEGKFYNADGKGMGFYQGKKDFGEKFIDAPTTWTTQVTKVAKNGDILMSVRAPVGPINFATDEVCIGRGLAAIRSGSELDRDFLFYQLLHLQPLISGREGAVFASINKSEIEALPLSFAPLPEQHRIVAILDEAFAGIATARANAEQNLKNARELFESHLQSVFTQRGDGWVEYRLGDVCDFSQGVQVDVKLQSEDMQGFNKVRFLRIVDFTQGNESPRYIDNPGEKYVVNESDVSLVRYGACGFVCSGLNGAIANNLFRVIPKNKQITNGFLYWFLKSPLFQDVIKKSMNGVAMPAISFGMINDIFIPFPSESEQRSLISKLGVVFDETQRLEVIYQKKITALDELKKALLHKAFSGEL